MYTNFNRETLIQIIQKCSGKLHPTRDDDMYIFYMGICSLKKAIAQADANVRMDLTDDEASKMTYRKSIEDKLSQVEEQFQNYVCDIKGFEDASYYHHWLDEMEHVVRTKCEWFDKSTECSRIIHSAIVA